MAALEALEQDTPGYCGLANNWWLFVLRGVLALILAVLFFLMPAESLLVLTLVYGAFSLIDGLFSLVSAIRKIRKGQRWAWLVFRGIVGIIAGVAVLILPFVATWVLAVFLWISLGAWSLIIGLFELLAAWRLRKEIKGEFWLALSGCLSIALGLLVVWMFVTRPAETFFSAGWVVGGYAAFMGVFLIMLGLRLRKAHLEQTAVKANGADPSLAI